MQTTLPEPSLTKANCRRIAHNEPLLHRTARCAQAPISSSVCWAIINSSSVGMTYRPTGLCCRDICSFPEALAAGSKSTPSQVSFSATRARIVVEFSPIPPVKINASIPPSAAASVPA